MVQTAAEGRPMVVTTESAPAEHPPSVDIDSLQPLLKEMLTEMFEILGRDHIDLAMAYAHRCEGCG